MANLMDYFNRMKEKYWQDWDDLLHKEPVPNKKEDRKDIKEDKKDEKEDTNADKEDNKTDEDWHFKMLNIINVVIHFTLIALSILD